MCPFLSIFPSSCWELFTNASFFTFSMHWTSGIMSFFFSTNVKEAKNQFIDNAPRMWMNSRSKKKTENGEKGQKTVYEAWLDLLLKMQITTGQKLSHTAHYHTQICSYLYSSFRGTATHVLCLIILKVPALCYSSLGFRHTWIPFRFTLLLRRTWSGKKNLLSSGESSEVEESSASWPLAFGPEVPKAWEITVMGRFRGKL